LRAVQVTQIGEDLIVRVETIDPEVEVRSKSSYDAIREEHLFVLDLTKAGTTTHTPAQIRRDIARVEFSPSDPCEAKFEGALREVLEPERLARAFRNSGTHAHLYQREAMLARGRLDHGQVRTLEGERFRTGSSLELEVALQSGPRIEGYLALLGAYARSQKEPATVLRSLIAPDLSAAAFEPLHGAAEAERRECRRGSSR
jgi:hypothetical protein